MEYVVSKDYKTGDKILGRVAFTTLQECFSKVKPGDRIYLRNEVYYGKFILRCNDITLIGMDESIISYDAYHGEKIRECDGGDGHKVYGTTGSATFTVSPMASGFKMFNVTVQNTHEWVRSEGQQAVAFKSEAENGYYEECKFIGLQDTLYVMADDNVFNKCFISGTIDFIFGAGNVILDNCSIVIRSKESPFNYICAPNTRIVSSYGLYFHRCNISSDVKGSESWLGRPWFDAGTKYEIVPRCMFYRCILPSNLHLGFIKMRDNDPDKYEMYYYKCIYKREEVSNTEDERLIDFYEKIYSQRR